MHKEHTASTSEQARLKRAHAQVSPHAQPKLEQAGPSAKPMGGMPDLSMFPDSAGPVSPIGPLAQDGGEWDDEGDDLCDGDDDASMGGVLAPIFWLRVHSICQVPAIMQAFAVPCARSRACRYTHFSPAQQSHEPCTLSLLLSCLHHLYLH